MSEFTYIEHLQIPSKKRGSILHAEEYNATVNKINEIVDNLRASYDYNNSLPEFDEISDIHNVNTDNGTPVIIHNVGEKYYPITSSSYVTVGDNKYLDEELTYIETELDTVKNNVNDVNEKIQNIDIPSYYGSDSINIDSENNVSVNTSYIINNIIDNDTLIIENDKIKVNASEVIQDLSDDLSYNITYVNELINDVNDVIQKIDTKSSYYGSDTINVDENNIISINKSYLLDDIIDNTYLNIENDKITIDNDSLLHDVRTDIEQNKNDINTISNNVSYLNDKVNGINIPSYYGSDSISVDENNVISLNASYLIENVEKPSIYLNEEGKLVINNEVVLGGIEHKLKFIDEDGKWLGGISQVKEYIDENDEILDNKIDNTKTELYAYMDKFVEFDTFGKNYVPTNEFLNKNRF